MLSMMKSFIKDIQEHPDDESRRLIFADWLEDNGDPNGLAQMLRAGRIPFLVEFSRREDFEKAIIAQDDDNDYQESGYVVVRVGNWCALSDYGHCSCFGTWTDLNGCGSDGIRWCWMGTYEELLELARNGMDPALPQRKADPADSDYDHLMAVYGQVLSSYNLVH